MEMNKWTVMYLLAMLVFWVGGTLCGIAAEHARISDCSQEYNKGYGDAIQFTLDQQRTSFNSSGHLTPNYDVIFYDQSDNWINGTTLPNNCYENETAYNQSDLVAHLQCPYGGAP